MLALRGALRMPLCAEDPATQAIEERNMSLFDPSRDEVRAFFIDAWKKTRSAGVATPLEAMAGAWAEQHPEYHQLLEDENARQAEFTPEGGKTNPFLHLSMHLSISEQISIDQPPGIRAAATRLGERLGSSHEAQHAIMECLGEMLWNSQRQGLPPDGAAYIECVERRATS
jgi:hypothetical protein